MTRTLAGIVAVLLLSACGATRMYSGPPLSRGEVAVVKGSRAIGGVRIYFAGIDDDGKEFAASKIEVSVGRLRLTVHYYNEARTAPAIRRTISFRAAGGHTYQVKALEHGEVWIWIEDTSDGRVVGGKKP